MQVGKVIAQRLRFRGSWEGPPRTQFTLYFSLSTSRQPPGDVALQSSRLQCQHPWERLLGEFMWEPPAEELPSPGPVGTVTANQSSEQSSLTAETGREPRPHLRDKFQSGFASEAKQHPDVSPSDFPPVRYNENSKPHTVCQDSPCLDACLTVLLPGSEIFTDPPFALRHSPQCFRVGGRMSLLPTIHSLPESEVPLSAWHLQSAGLSAFAEATDRAQNDSVCSCPVETGPRVKDPLSPPLGSKTLSHHL